MGNEFKGIKKIEKSKLAVHGRDTFETPEYAINLLLPYIPKDVMRIWEPACGSGKIVRYLQLLGYGVLGTDLAEKSSSPYHSFNFITDDLASLGFEYHADFTVDCIITNPPYSIKEMFIDKAMECGVPWAMLINADYSGEQIKWVTEYNCEKIIPNRRIDYITPTGKSGTSSKSQFHSMWLTSGFKLGRTETFVDLPLEWKKERI